MEAIGQKVAVSPMRPMLMTVEQMSKISGLGENRLRKLLVDGEIEYIQNGNRRLIAEHAFWDWYSRAKITVSSETTNERRI